MSRSSNPLANLLALLATVVPLHASGLEIKHTPPLIDSLSSDVNIELFSDSADRARLLIVTPDQGIEAIDLFEQPSNGESDKKFTTSIPSEKLQSNSYSFQVEDNSGVVTESERFTALDHTGAAMLRDLKDDDEEIGDLERKVAKQRRELAALKAQVGANPYSTEPQRVKAFNLLNEKESHE